MGIIVVLFMVVTIAVSIIALRRSIEAEYARMWAEHEARVSEMNADFVRKISEIGKA